MEIRSGETIQRVTRTGRGTRLWVWEVFVRVDYGASAHRVKSERHAATLAEMLEAEEARRAKGDSPTVKEVLTVGA